MPFTLNTSKMSEKEAKSRIDKFNDAITKFINDNKSKDNIIRGLDDFIEAALNFYDVLININKDLKNQGIAVILENRNKVIHESDINEWDKIISFMLETQLLKMTNELSKQVHLHTTDGKETNIKATSIMRLISSLNIMRDNAVWYKDLKTRKGIK